jgi:hypothetical protein
MLSLDQLAERRILESIERGELRGLPGEGKPLEFEDDTLVPEDVRAVYRVLKNAGFVPPELEARRDAAAIDRQLRESTLEDGGARRRAIARLALLRTRIETGYRERIIDRWSRAKR